MGRKGHIKADTEELALWQGQQACSLAQFIDCRQQHFRQTLMLEINALKVSPQHIQGIAQGGQTAILILADTQGDIDRLLKYLEGQQLGPD
ncbi:hypothetical protein AvCA_27610 [Azotobacter vinelandii CA]|uniref:Uncharacterized protein n=2 Tax=Azotobacter vinelandii TaxID=354 RepID=C1DKT3_AZOVD|nr:hypothetical protein Avin_27610 [Azotobacter vinelandii DJ]AGK14857.1 hypothetical protein AvCA_27610 [Azotobacter vinelandii CA]AGK20859.1 hypothetical protein AvCA6_27610 [Azotobacter vinelandii CA6]